MVNLYSGGCIDVLCGIRSLFKPIYGADIDKACRAIYIDITGRPCRGDVKSIKFEDEPPPVLLGLTPPCPDYSSSNPNPQGADGDKGGEHFVNIPQTVKLVRPLCVFIEQVGNAINFESELMRVLMGLQEECGMVVHCALVSMQQYGDIENCWRLPIVAWHASMGLWGENYSIPIGEFSDSVAYCAEDVATDTDKFLCDTDGL